MPKEAIIICQTCEEQFEGELPDDNPISRIYKYTKGKFNEIDPKLVKKLTKHHLRTQNPSLDGNKTFGHMHFDVYLPQGNECIGNLEVTSYGVVYRER